MKKSIFFTVLVTGIVMTTNLKAQQNRPSPPSPPSAPNPPKIEINKSGEIYRNDYFEKTIPNGLMQRSGNAVTITLKNGSKEEYNLLNSDDKDRFVHKFGAIEKSLPQPPNPPKCSNTSQCSN
ncbi:MAG: hypothetical protein WKG06_32460 [Segetibacter sp.]